MKKETCGTVEEYIAQFDAPVQARLRALRDTIRAAAPDAQEKISWGMPTYWQQGNVVHFAAAAKHIGFYPGESGVRMVLDKTGDYETSKGAVRFPNDQLLPLELVRDVTAARAAENERLAEQKKKK